MYKPTNTIKLVGEKSLADFIDVTLEDEEYCEHYMRVSNFDSLEAFKDSGAETYKAFKVEMFNFYGDEMEYRDEFIDDYIRPIDSFSAKGGKDLARVISALTRYQNTYEIIVSRGFTDYKDKENIVKYFSIYLKEVK